MDAGDNTKPRSLAEIGRSGTFIIENDDVVIGAQVQDKKETLVDAKISEGQVKSSQGLRGDPINLKGRRSSDLKTANHGKETSEIDFNQDKENSLGVDSKHDGRVPAYGRRRARILGRNAKGDSLDTSLRNESLEVVTRIDKGRSLDTGTEIKRVEWLDITSKNREAEAKSSGKHDGRDTLDDVTEAEAPDVVSETNRDSEVTGEKESQDVVPKTSENDGTGTIDDVGKEALAQVPENGDESPDKTEIEAPDATAKSQQESATLEDIRSEPLDVIKNDNEESSDPKSNQNDAFDSTSTTTIQIDQQDDDNDVEAEATHTISERVIADSRNLTDGAAQSTLEELTDPGVVTEPLKRARSSSRSSLDTEKEHPVPVPAPRRSVSKSQDEHVERYSVLRANFRERWESVANIPKFQNFDRATRSILQEQADRRLEELCPPNFDNDFKTLIDTVEQALERFYNQKIQEKDSSNNDFGGGQNMASQKITLEIIQEILLEEDPRIKVLSFTDEPGSGRGDNYTAMLYRVSINGELDGEPWKGSLIIKVLPQSISRRETYKSEVLFKNEVAFYKRMLPALQRFQMDRCGDVNRLIPRCVFAKDDVIALEDLRNTGFVMADRRKGLDAAEMEVVLREVARFHGMSLALKEEDRETFQRDILSNVRETFFVPENEEWYRGYYQAAIKNTVATVRDSLPPGIEAEKITTSLSTFLNKDSFFGQMVELVKPIEPLSVLTHGDCWTNNILFRKSEDGEIEEMRLVDFQVCRYGSPCLDLAMLFYVCTNRELRQAHMDRLLRLYHSSLVETLNILSPKKSDESPQPFYRDSEKLWAMLEKDMRRLAHFGLGIAVDMIPISTCDKEDAPDLYENDDPNYTPGPCAVPAYSDLSRSRMTELVQELSQAGIL